MAHESGGSKKRKYGEDVAISEFGPNFVHINVGSETIAIHEDLFFSYVKESDLTEMKPRAPTKGRPKTYHCHHSFSIVVRALAHWMYRRELPSEELIRRLRRSSPFDNPLGDGLGAWDESVACGMAYELNYLAHRMGIKKLQNETMDYLFIMYLEKGTLPCMERVNLVFIMLKQSDHPLRRFFIDIYYKKSELNATEDTSSLYSAQDESKFPKGFLYSIFLRHRWVNGINSQLATGKAPVPAASDASNGLPQSSANGVAAAPTKWVMRLCDYHVQEDPLKDIHHPVSCGCSKKGTEYIIK